jgi:hypothetical protein
MAVYLSTFHILRPGLPQTTPYAKFKEQAITSALQLNGWRHKVQEKCIWYFVTYARDFCPCGHWALPLAGGNAPFTTS